MSQEKKGNGMIRTWALGGAALAVASFAAAPVQSADLSGVPYVAANWSGFYVGANLGFANTTANVSASAFGFTVEGSGSDTQFTGGLLAGYNWQTGNQVFGIEADISFPSDYNYIASIRARYGQVYNNWLYYGTAGVGFIDSGSYISAPGWSYSGYSSAGFVVGGGAETKINSHLSAGLEGLYYYFPDDSQNLFGVNVKTNVDVFTIRARLTYQLDGSHDFLK
jgi:outer membrane immunogenic protein